MKITGIDISYGFAESPFGKCFIAWFENKICQLSFFDNAEYEFEMFEDKFKGNKFIQNDRRASQLAQQIFEQNERPQLYLEGTEFQLKVWETLNQIHSNTTTTYADIADLIGKPKAVRAVGTAVGANPIAYLIPCHRVIRTDGTLGGYRWGLEVKKKMLAYEKSAPNP
jgi:AraC family transcriptional regulator of adaptative response/methylated-DNA-[protein]-cysteine methyltransferase